MLFQISNIRSPWCCPPDGASNVYSVKAGPAVDEDTCKMRVLAYARQFPTRLKYVYTL